MKYHNNGGFIIIDFQGAEIHDVSFINIPDIHALIDKAVDHGKMIIIKNVCLCGNVENNVYCTQLANCVHVYDSETIDEDDYVFPAFNDSSMNKLNLWITKNNDCKVYID